MSRKLTEMQRKASHKARKAKARAAAKANFRSFQNRRRARPTQPDPFAMGFGMAVVMGAALESMGRPAGRSLLEEEANR